MVYYAKRTRTDLQDDEIDALVDELFAGHTEGTRDHVKRDMHDFYRRWQSIHDQKSKSSMTPRNVFMPPGISGSADSTSPPTFVRS